MPKSLVCVMPRINVEVAGIASGKFKDAGAAAISKVVAMAPEQIGLLVIESLKSHAALAYPMDFTEVVEEAK